MRVEGVEEVVGRVEESLDLPMMNRGADMVAVAVALAELRES